MQFVEGKKRKNDYGKRTLTALLCMALLLSFTALLSACGGGFTPVPNVMGIGHDEAKTVLENAGFKVTEIEADAETILTNANEERTVMKGQVFKVNDKTDFHYSDYKGNPMAKDKKVTIYYAAEDFIYEKPDPTTNAEDLDDEPDDEMTDTSTAASATKDPVTKESTAAPTTKDPTTKAPTAAPTTKAPVTAAPTAAPANKTNWKQFLQEYEAWIDSYLVILKKYRDNPADLSILSDYMEAMQKLTEWAEKVDKIESELADSPEALAEYLAAISRILGKISQFE